jgi:CRP/FNR family transcriptional regulator
MAARLSGNSAMLRAVAMPAAAARSADWAGEPSHVAFLPPPQMGDTFRLLPGYLPVARRLVHAGDKVYSAGEPFRHLYVLNSGYFKVVCTTADGREQVVGLHFRGDWLGFDGIAAGTHACDAVALETGEVWALPYGALLQACLQHPALLADLHAEMSRAITRGHDSMFSRCQLPAAARVAGFLHRWAASLGLLGLCSERITLRMTRADIGDFLGMSEETVSRAMSALAAAQVIGFSGKGRRNVVIADPRRLAEFIHQQARPRA